MPIDGEKYKVCIPGYFNWSPDKTDFTNIGGGKVVDTVKI
jgi:hypothetical protein